MSRFKWQNAECSFWRSKLWKPVAVGQVFLSHWSLSAGRVPAVGLIFTLISPALLMQTELTSALQVSHSTPNPFSHHCCSSNAKSYLLSLIPADPQLLVSFPVLLHSSLCLFFCSPFFLTALIFFSLLNSFFFIRPMSQRVSEAWARGLQARTMEWLWWEEKCSNWSGMSSPSLAMQIKQLKLSLKSLLKRQTENNRQIFFFC